MNTKSHHRPLSFLAVLVSISLLLVGCKSRPNQPVKVESCHECFFKPYENAFKKFYSSHERELIQLGFPTETSISIWYLLEECRKPVDAVRIRVDGNLIPSDRVIHHYNTDYCTGLIQITGLTPGEEYRVEIENEAMRGDLEVVAYTKPANRNESFSFLFGSCLQPYNYEKETPHIRGSTLSSLANLKNRSEMRGLNTGPSFYLGIGDQIYVDPGAAKNAEIAYLSGSYSEKIRGYVNEAPEYLNELYRFHFGIPDLDDAYRSIPSVLMWDDHDIRDGWGSHGDEHNPQWRNYYQHARDAFVAFQAARNPNFDQIINAKGWNKPKLSVDIPNDDLDQMREQELLNFAFDWGQASFFIVDGRSTKTRGNLIYGKQQQQEIIDWLKDSSKADEPTVFVFANPVPVTGNVGKFYKFYKMFRTSDQDDLHDRITKEDRDWLLKTFGEHFTQNKHHKLLILSGDVHYSGLQSLRMNNKGEPFGYELISSGLAQKKYNAPGGYVGTVSGYVTGSKHKIVSQIHVQDHGMYSGPCFTEVFISKPETKGVAPEIGLLFYPAMLDDDLEGGQLLQLDWLSGDIDDLIDAEVIPSIDNDEVYSKNTPALGRNTNNNLPCNLKTFWEQKAKEHKAR